MIDQELVVEGISRSNTIQKGIDTNGEEVQIDAYGATTRIDMQGLGVKVSLHFYDDVPAALNDLWRIRLERLPHKNA